MAMRRRRLPWIELPDPIAGSGENDPERLWLRREQGDELHKAVRAVPLDQREAVLLKFEGRLKNREIGVIIGRSEGAVEPVPFRAGHGLGPAISETGKAPVNR